MQKRWRGYSFPSRKAGIVSTSRGMKSIAIDGPRLRRLRHGKRLSGDALAKQIGRTRDQVYHVEQGRSRASMELLDSLSEIFGESAVAELITNDDDRAAFLARGVPAAEAAASAQDWRDWRALGRAVKERRQALGLGSQLKIAERAGISLNTWGRLESGIAVGPATLTQAASVLEWTEAAMTRILIGESADDRSVGEKAVPEAAQMASTARELCKEAVRGAEGGWVSREVGSFAAAVLAALDEEGTS